MKHILFFLLFLSSILFPQSKEENNLWKPFQYFMGNWEGTGDGRWGVSTVKREYSFFMGNTFLLGKNKSIYEKQEKNPEGEIHDNWDIFSYDKQRRKFVLRQFHAEDIVNQYTVDSTDANQKQFEFVSESIENFGNGWRSKESYKIVNENEFVETFSLAAPGKEFQVYVTNYFKRKK